MVGQRAGLLHRGTLGVSRVAGKPSMRDAGKKTSVWLVPSVPQPGPRPHSPPSIGFFLCHCVAGLICQLLSRILELDEANEVPGSGCHRVRQWCLATSFPQRCSDRGPVGKAVGEDGRCKLLTLAVFPLVIGDTVSPAQRETSGPGVCQRTDAGQRPPPEWENAKHRPMTNLLCLSQRGTLPLL